MTTVNNQNQVSSSLLNTMNGTSSSSSSSASTSSTSTSTNSASSLTQEFMTLLVAQMQNQDPMNPMDNSQVTSQLAQLNTVTGINNLNTTLNSLMSNYQANQTYQASSLIGHNVLAAGDTISTSGSGGYFGVQLPNGADSLQVNILDSSGNTVRTLNYGSQQSGSPTFQWDGYQNDGTVAPSGTYTFNVTAKLAGTTTSSTALGVASVSSVSNNSGTISLNLSNNSSIPTSSVVQVF